MSRARCVPFWPLRAGTKDAARPLASGLSQDAGSEQPAFVRGGKRVGVRLPTE